MFSCAASVRCVSSTFSVFSEWPAPFGSPATSNLHYHYRQTETGGEDEGMDDCSDNTGYCQKKKPQMSSLTAVVPGKHPMQHSFVASFPSLSNLC